MRIIVHGGAGSQPIDPGQRATVLDEAAESGSAAEGPAEAVCEAVRILESDPRFNAGVGGAVQSDGHVRTDAGLMTDDRSIGAACAMPGVEHAIDVARIVMEETPHVLVAGVHAVDLAAAFGVEVGVDLRTEHTRERWADVPGPRPSDPRTHAAWVRDRFDGDSSNVDRVAGDDDHDTVGAVATDGECVATATATAGRWFALAGRVGDVPQVGSGFYCTAAGGASATGAGEDIARVTLARSAIAFLEAGYDAQSAADAAVAEFDAQVESSAGVIVLTPDGDTGEAFDTAAMQTSVAGGV